MRCFCRRRIYTCMDNMPFDEGNDFPLRTFARQSACADPVTRAASALGIRGLRPWQRLVIANVLDGTQEPAEEGLPCSARQIVLLPTGAGKSLCFLIPALLLEGPTLVVYPLLALMADQRRRMDEAGIESVSFHGGQSEDEREDNFRRIEGGARLILANPEVLQSEALLARLRQCRIAHIAVDEAHCVSEWGDTFRPAYLALGSVIKALSVRTVTALTATASPSVLRRVADVLFDGEAHIVRSESDRANIRYYVHYSYAKKRAAMLLALMEQRPLLIFCGTRAKSEDMARDLAAVCGVESVRFYHAGLSREEKSAVERWFYPKSDGILCCTCAYGMGVDKKDIRTVIHLEPGETAESYVQEAGRGGRDGGVAKAILLWSPMDSQRFSRFEAGSRQGWIRAFAETDSCRRQVLLDALGGEQAVCSGCDVCDGVREQSAGDADFVMEHVHLYRNCYSAEEMCSVLKESANRACRDVAGVNVWETGDFEEILRFLQQEARVRTHRHVWKGRLAPARSARLSGGQRLLLTPRLRLLHHRRLLQPLALVSAGRQALSFSP